jgi:hypothetical protein
MSEKHELLYIMNPGCGWCKKSDPVVEKLVASGYDIITLDITNADDAKRANEAKHKYNAQCGTPHFLDAETGNQVCGFREDVLEDWAKGKDIPPPPAPTRPQGQQPPQQGQQPPNVQQHQVNRPTALDYKEQKMTIWNMAKDVLVEKYLADYEVWNNWQFAENGMVGECPISKKPTFPTVKSINDTAVKITDFTK